MASSITISGVKPGVGAGPQTIGPLTITANASIGAVTDIVLASGANTITVPAGSTAMVIVPPTTNTQTLTLKGVTGDTGVPLSPTQPSVISFPASAPSTVVLTAGALFSGITEISFI